MKKCSNSDCEYKGKLQPFSNFYPDDYAFDGWRYHCKDCGKIYNQKYSKTNQGKKISIGEKKILIMKKTNIEIIKNTERKEKKQKENAITKIKIK